MGYFATVNMPETSHWADLRQSPEGTKAGPAEVEI